MHTEAASSASRPQQLSGTPRRRKIAVLIGTLEVGGAEQDIVRNFPRLDRAEFEVVVVCFDYAGPLAPVLRRQGIRVLARNPDPGVATEESVRELGRFGRFVRALPEWVKPPARAAMRFSRSRLLRAIGAARYMWGVTRWVGRALRAEQADVVHAFLPHSYAYAMFAARLWCPSAKTVMSRLSLNFYREDQRFLAWLERSMLHARVDAGVGNSSLILAELAEEGVPRERLALLYNGIDLAPFRRFADSRRRARTALGIEQPAFVMASLGNLWAHKGHRTLIEACGLVREQLPAGWLLLIAGRDQEGNASLYADLVAKLGLGEHVKLLGACDEVVRLLFSADLYVHPSLHEGLPNAIIEAMAASLPVVATNVGGIPEVVVAVGAEGASVDATGWLVTPGDPVKLGEALLVAEAAGSERRAAMGEHGRIRAEEQFSLDRSVRDYEELYRRLLSIG